MGEMLRGFLDNDSSFGRLMTRCGIVIGANIMFVLFSLPVVTAGASYVALYHVMLKTLRGDGVLNPFKQFWVGFKNNFKQATIYWVVLLALVVFGYVDVTFCRQMGGVWEYFMYAIYALGIVALIVTLMLFPTMAAFADTIPHLMRNAVFFAVKKPFRLIVILFFNVFPLYLTYTDAQMQPLYAFLWATFGFGAVALLGSVLLLPDFKVYLPPVDACGDIIENPEEGVAEKTEKHEKTEAERLKEMKKLGM
ncbi:MAG: YesL family protein [Eubacteriales bacterium]|nr:YesL family protein [Eubacteriales bacterium]